MNRFLPTLWARATGLTSPSLVQAALLAMLLSVLLAGCFEGRTAGTTLDDQNTELRVIDAIYETPEIGTESHIKVEVYEGIVLLVGETDSDAKRELAGRRAASVGNVERVVNDVVVAERAGVGTRAGNSWLTASVNTALATKDSEAGFDAGRIKVISSDGAVYLMGNVTRAEGDAAAEVARNVRGVDKVVKVFNYSE
jgi:osmotically-inducible protein OsmY